MNVKADQFVQPVCLAQKHDKGSIKVTLDARELNKHLNSMKAQMPRVESLIESISLIAQQHNPFPVWYSRLDLNYAFGQLSPHPSTSKHCNFGVIGGNYAGTWKIDRGFYGLCDTPLIFQQLIDACLANNRNAFAFLDHVLVVSKSSVEEHMKLVRKTIEELVESNFRLSAKKCSLLNNNVEWLGFTLKEKSISPLTSKIEAISKLTAPKNLKTLESFMGSVNQMVKFVPKLSSYFVTLKHLLKEKN